MSYGPVKAYTVSIASGTATSAVLDLSGKSYTQMAVNTGTPGALVSVYGASSSTASPLPLQVLVTTTATVAYQSLQIPTSTSGSWAVFEAPPFEYVQFVASAAVANGTTLTVMLSD